MGWGAVKWPSASVIQTTCVSARVSDSLEHRATDLHRHIAILALHTVSSVVARAALDGLDLRAWHEHQNVARLEPKILHAQMTGNVVAHLAERPAEIPPQFADAPLTAASKDSNPS